MKRWPKSHWHLIVAACLLASLFVFWAYSSPAQPAPADPATPLATLTQGAPMTAVGFAALDTGDECADKPLMLDHRSPDDPSYSILRRLEVGDYDFAQAWAGFQPSDLYGCRRATAGQKYLDLYAIELKCGPATLQPQVLDQTGMPKANTLVFLNWPGMGDANVFPPEGVDPPYFNEGVGGFTDGGGSVGFGFGSGSQLTVGQGGPFSVWAGSDPASWLDRVVGSDALTKIGWMDNHCTFNPIFQITYKSGMQPLPGGYRLRNVGPNGEDLGYIPFLSDVPPAGVGVLELWQGDIRQGYMQWQTP
jgi:hypothetical protein